MFLSEVYLSTAELQRNPGVEVGQYVSIKEPGKESKLLFGKLIRFGRSGLAMIRLNSPTAEGDTNISVPPSWVFAKVDDAWPQPKWSRKPVQGNLT